VSAVPGKQVGRDPRPVSHWRDGLLGIGWIVLVAGVLLGAATLLAWLLVTWVVGRTG
jgi:hypothetical protein